MYDILNLKYDHGLVKARREFDDKKRAELIKQAFKIIHDDVGTALLWNNVTVYAMQKNIAFTPTKSAYSLVMLKDIEPAK
jgi:ABC-type transport system substrate-binding protein